jgi:hypothetical protein
MLVANHKYDDHFIKFTYISKDYYLICEEEKYLNHLFYCFVKCDFLVYFQYNLF